MSIFSKMKRRAIGSRAAPNQALIWFGSSNGFDDILCSGYTRLSQNPEVSNAVDKIANLIASMTIHLMQNGENGDIRIKNELSRVIDIEPNRYMNRANFIHWIVKTMLLEGDGNAVVLPQTENGFLRQLIPQAPSKVSLLPNNFSWGYRVIIQGYEYDPGDVLHFVVNEDNNYPWKGIGYKVSLRDVVNNLQQAAITTNAFLKSEWKPSLVVKVDGMTEEFSSPEGRSRLLDDYIKTSRAGEPWLLPADQFEVSQIKPLSLNDLAISDMVQLDKKTVASILGVPPFVLGIGEFNRDAWNNFISATIMPLAKIIEQELTRKLLYSHDLFFRFNSRSLYNYDLKDLASIADEQYVRGLMTGNEARSWLGLPPREGLDKLVILENYIPIDRIGDQKKLKQNGGDE